MRREGMLAMKTVTINVADPDPDPDWIRIQSGLWIRIQGHKKYKK